MEDNSNQQWSWTMTVGTVVTLYGFISLYNSIVIVIGNIWFCPRPQAVPATPPTPAS
jgi:hypothetical protein